MNSNPRFDSCDDVFCVADLRRLAAVVGGCGTREDNRPCGGHKNVLTADVGGQ